MSVIPLQETAEYTIRIDLDEIPCAIRIYWNEFSDATKAEYDTTGFWAMDLSNSIFDIKGIKIVGGTDLMWPYSQPFGGFILYDMDLENKDPEFDGIGTRWQLNYVPISDIRAVREALSLEII